MAVIQLGIVGIVGFLIISYILGVYHVIEEGHIGIYTRGGALLEGYSNPGSHMMFPVVTKFH